MGFSNPNYGVIKLQEISSPGYFNRIVFSVHDSINDIYLSPNMIYAGSSPQLPDQHFLKSIDNGQAWFTQNCSESGGISADYILKINMANDSVGFALGQNNIYKTANGGGALVQQVGTQYTALKELSENDILHIFPNPSSENLTIQINSSENFFLKIYNLLGEEIRSENMVQINDLDVSDFPKGIYIFRISVGNNNYFEKVIIE